jgi:hypothetical protein
MVDDRELRSWVDDQLYALLGYAEGALSAYIIALGEEALRACAGSTQGPCHRLTMVVLVRACRKEDDQSSGPGCAAH